MTTEEELIEFNKRWDEAMIGNNAEEIGKYMSEDWVIIGTEGGITTKDSFLAEISSGNLTHSRMDAKESRVRIYGDTAVFTSCGTSAGKYKGHAFEFFEWSTSLFVKAAGIWNCVLTMLTPANKPGV